MLAVKMQALRFSNIFWNSTQEVSISSKNSACFRFTTLVILTIPPGLKSSESWPKQLLILSFRNVQAEEHQLSTHETLPRETLRSKRTWLNGRTKLWMPWRKPLRIAISNTQLGLPDLVIANIWSFQSQIYYVTLQCLKPSRRCKRGAWDQGVL